MIVQWTKPYYSVSHIANVPRDFKGFRQYQITMYKVGGEKSNKDLYLVYFLHLGGNHAFTPVKENYGTQENCKKVAEKWFKQIT